MKSATRQDCENAVIKFSKYINQTSPTGDLLYVGIAGDPKGGEYAPLFPKYNIKTVDKDPKWQPDIIDDISYPIALKDTIWNLIVCVQVIEHIEEVGRVPSELNKIISDGGYLIIDCPWNYPYHAEPPSFKDYWRISKDGMLCMFEPYFKTIEVIQTEHNTSCLFQKEII